MSLDTIGLVCLIENHLQQAEQFAREALQIHQQIEDVASQAYDHNHLGLIFLAGGGLEAAAEQHAEALRLRRGLGHETSALDDLAGLARVALAQGDSALAAGYARQILTGLEDYGADGLEFPVWVYLTCYRSLKAPEPEKARLALAAGYTCLQKSADNLQEDAQRRGFLENVPWNRELLNEYAACRHDERQIWG